MTISNLIAKSAPKISKMRQFLELLPEIEKARLAGYNVETIVEALKTDGLDITVKAYSVMLVRARKRQGKVAPLPASTVTQAPQPVRETTQPPKVVVDKAAGGPKTFNWPQSDNEKHIW